MEEGDRSVDQSMEVEVQGDAPALHNVSGSATPAPSVPQFPTLFAKQMAAMFQQMAGNICLLKYHYRHQWYKHSLLLGSITN